MDKFAFQRAVMEGDTCKLRQLIAEGVSAVDSREDIGFTELLISIKDDLGRTPLHLAIIWKQYEVVEFFINNNCDLNLKDDEGSTPLHWAIIFERYKMAELLISNNCDLNLKDNLERTPLQLAAAGEWNKIPELLISNKCDLNLKDRAGRTAVMLAAMLCKKDFVGFLLQHGAQVSCKDVIKYTLLHWVSTHGWDDIVHRILDGGEADPNSARTGGYTPLMQAAREGHAEVASLLIRAGAGVNRKNEKMSTALHSAARFGHTGTIQVLLGVEGLELNPQDNEGFSPLHMSCIGGETQVVRQLLEAGADATLKSNDGETALSEGIKRQVINIQEIIRLFVDRGHFLEDSEYTRISTNPVLRESVLRDVDLCTQSIVNQFNRQSLPALYNIPHVARSLPRTKKLNLRDAQTRQVAHFVASEIGAKTYCNVVAVQPVVLQVLCVQALIAR